MDLDLRSSELVGGMYKPYPTRSPLHLGGFVLIHTRTWWASGLHGNTPVLVLIDTYI